jgi:hypothetical protein
LKLLLGDARVTESPPQPEAITRLFDAVYPSFAILAGMELDLFTPVNIFRRQRRKEAQSSAHQRRRALLW